MDARPRIHLVDDDDIERWTARRLLGGLQADFVEHPSAAAFLAAYEPYAIECVVLDLRMPGCDGLEVQRRLRTHDVGPPIVFVSAYAEVPAAVQAIRGGADEFLSKPYDSGALFRAVNAALARSPSNHALRLRRSAVRARFALLSQREYEVIEAVSAGRTSREIADTLGLSVRTVENHRSRAMDKLHVGSVAELTRAVIDAGRDARPTA